MSMNKEWKHWYPNRFGIDFLAFADCGAGGNCQFLALARLLRHHLKIDGQDLRELVLRQWQLTPAKEREELFEMWSAEKAFSTFPEKLRWVATPDDLGRALELPLQTGNGWDFEGDALSLLLLSRCFKCLIGVFNENAGLYTVSGDKEKSRFVLLLRLIDSGSFRHFQALGLTTADNMVIKCPSVKLLSKLQPDLTKGFSVTLH